MSTYKLLSLLYGPNPHHLDHLASWAQVMDIPLFVTEKNLLELAEKYYPDLVTFYGDYNQTPQQIVQEYDAIFTTLPRDTIEQIFFLQERLQGKKLLSAWLPHGNSDKGYASYMMEALKAETFAMVYGQKMIDFLKDKGIFRSLYHCMVTGNFRHQCYQKHKKFMDQVVEEKIFSHFEKKQTTLLYAPTWQDSEQNCSFFQVMPKLLQTLPANHNLIIKLHPNFERQNEPEILRLREEIAIRRNIQLLGSMPWIYPLLSRIDLYLGDMSSIGYDFLTFNRPMFFINATKRNPQKDPGLYLFRCGKAVTPKDLESIFQTDQQKLSQIREETYNYTFGPSRRWEEIRLEFLTSYERFREHEIDFY